MASPDVDSPWLCAASESFGGCFNIQIEEVKSTNNVKVLEATTSSVSDARDIPKPPPYPSTTSTTTSHCRRISASCSVLKETKDTWDRLFKEAYGSNVYIITYSNSYIPAHCNVLLARSCDAPQLSFICVHMVVKDLKSVSSTESWKVMRGANPALEQELVESVVEADLRKQQRLRKIEERKVYLQLYEAMEALLHICRDGCRTIGPCDQMLKGSQVACNFPACKALESSVRHFSRCKSRVPGGCIHCKRMWQLLELHSRMCNEPDSCKVPLCR